MPSLSSCLETIESRIFELEVRWLKKSLHKCAESLHWRLKRLEELPAVEETVQEDEVPGLACQVSSLEVRTSKLEIGQGSAGNSGPNYSFDEETIYEAIAADSTLNYLFDEEDIYNASIAPDFRMNFIDDEEVIYDAIPALDSGTGLPVGGYNANTVVKSMQIDSVQSKPEYVPHTHMVDTGDSFQSNTDYLSTEQTSFTLHQAQQIISTFPQMESLDRFKRFGMAPQGGEGSSHAARIMDLNGYPSQNLLNNEETQRYTSTTVDITAPLSLSVSNNQRGYSINEKVSHDGRVSRNTMNLLATSVPDRQNFRLSNEPQMSHFG